ncbi:putative RTA1 domain protein [Amylocarpus encephaloides]|uniref:RTA1 domain protein n=1 Tax=Amylocarpus encephaloides TaxID=45428 RepID=A0A9P7YFQ6_9HELO|nr:putative RTA1 domain protein [Amylocarpus encephaloides]
MSSDKITNYYSYSPNHVLPAVFGALIGISLLIHTGQNFRYRYWRVTFFMFYGGAVFASGWILRVLSSYQTDNLNLYIAQYILILCGPPIYSAAEYNVLGRMMHYLPMHAPLNPSRVTYFFVYLGATVESLTAAGASLISNADARKSALRTGGTMVVISVILQAVVECLFMFMVAMMYNRCQKSKMLTPNLKNVCIMLFGTSILVLFRCVFRIVEYVSILKVLTSDCGSACVPPVLKNEWYIYAFEAAPMLLYTYWLNIMHPGRMLPSDSKIYLDFNRQERVGPGWKDKRPLIMSFCDPFDLEGMIKGRSAAEKYWLRPDDWSLVDARTGKEQSGVQLARTVEEGIK